MHSDEQTLLVLQDLAEWYWMGGGVDWVFFLEIYGFTFNFEVMNTLKSRGENGLIQFMVYDDTFYKFFKDFPKMRK